jgi:Nucleotidyl transferase AbiEii toxin, Type IV TA system
MNAIANLSNRDRQDLFTEAAARTGLPPFHLEKDFWVCWTLGVLFQHSNTREHLTFRGGTSLSKAWQIIERFSEDIDLSISRQWFENEKDPGEAGLALKEIENRLQTLRRNCRTAIETKLQPVLQEAAESLPEAVQIIVEPLAQARDPFCIFLHYPRTDLPAPEDYNRPAVKVELSGRAEGWPMEPRSFRPYVAEALPELETGAEVTVPTVSPARTFWEKAALVNEQLSRPGDRPLPAFQARHLYDLHRLWQRTEVTQFPDLTNLFESVKQHRAIFFGYNWMDYSGLRPSALKIVPENEKAAEWRDDYARMRPMFFTEPPTFDDLLIHLREIEKSLTTFD